MKGHWAHLIGTSSAVPASQRVWLYTPSGVKRKPKLIKSNRETVTLLTKLKGMGREAPCTVSAIKVSLPEFRIMGFVRCEVLQAPDDLPNGEYFVILGGRTMLVQKQDGDWLRGGV
jgi:hypothetical protein